MYNCVNKWHNSGNIPRVTTFANRSPTCLPMAHRVVLYSKPGCHLCEITYQLLEGLHREFEFTLEEIDIAPDSVLLERYGEKIPVVIIDNQTTLFAPIHLVHVRAALTSRLD